jgi:hypothetical protein
MLHEHNDKYDQFFQIINKRFKNNIMPNDSEKYITDIAHETLQKDISIKESGDNEELNFNSEFDHPNLSFIEICDAQQSHDKT